jgi:cleavage and polyadenylation specificity factor subunit 1
MTEIEGVKTMSSLEDRLDRLLISFKDTKVRFVQLQKEMNAKLNL